MATYDALKLAKSQGLSLVEIVPNADPPVCKIIDHGKYKYDIAKQKKDSVRPKGGRVKEVKFRINIDDHDYRTKITRAEDFLAGNHKLRIQLQFRGRQMAHKELGFKLMDRVSDDLKTMGHNDAPARLAGRHIIMQMTPFPEAQRVRKFRHKDDEIPDHPDDDHDDDHDDDDDHLDSLAGGTHVQDDHEEHEEVKPKPKIAKHKLLIGDPDAIDPDDEIEIKS